MKGHVRERPEGSGNWYAVIDVRDPATGKRKRKFHSLDATGKREAQIECANLISAIDGGTYLEPDKTTMAQFLDRWLENIKPNVSPRTHERYGEIARRNIAPLIGGVMLSKLKPAQISEAYAKALSKGRRDGKGGLLPQTVGHMHRVLKQSLKQAVRWELLHRNPAEAVDAPKVDKREMRVYDVPQTVDLIEAVRGKRVFIPVVLAAMCGMRRGEIAAVRWRNVDLDKGTLSVVQSAEQTQAGVRYTEPKRGKTRNLSLSASVVLELRAWRAQQAQEMLRLGIRPTADTLICTTAAGEGIQPNSLTHEWLKSIEGTALPRIRFHDLRHTHATHMLASGVHVKIASERLGHSKIGITLDLYSHVMPGMQEDAVAKVDAAFLAAQRKP
jgi:integrase